VGKKKKKVEPADGIMHVAENRKARHHYKIEDVIECGLELRGTEVKSLRAREMNFADSYALVKNDEIFLLGLQITPFRNGTHENHEPDRTRRLLLKRKEIDKLVRATLQKGVTLVPLKIYFKKGWAKVAIGIGKGKTHSDKRETIKKRESDREMQRAMKSRR
jgi:SsrA-binding protein